MKTIEINGVTKNMRKQTVVGSIPGVPLIFIGSKTDVVANTMKSMYEHKVTMSITAYASTSVLSLSIERIAAAL
jgi:hypothetical protein